MTEQKRAKFNELLAARPHIDVVRDRAGDVIVYTPRSRLFVSVLRETQDQEPYVGISVLPPYEVGSNRQGYVKIHPTPAGVRIESKSELEKIDPQVTIETATSGLELFETARRAGLRNVTQESEDTIRWRVNDAMETGDNDLSRLALMGRAADAFEVGKTVPEWKPWDLPSGRSQYMLKLLKRASEKEE